VISIAVAFFCFVLICGPARGLVGGVPSATGDIARSVLGIVGPHNSFCTATAVARNVLLSAAHCVQQGANYRAQFRDTNGLRAFSDSVEWERLPQYKPPIPRTAPVGDLALLKLATPLPAEIGIAVLELHSPPIWPGDRFTVIGGGIPFRGLHETGFNRAATLVATGPFSTLQIRLIDPSGPKSGVCFGDSGSPVFQSEADGTRIVGVVSWASGPNNTKGCGGLTGATPLSPYRQWIEGTLNRLGDGSTNPQENAAPN
jgi:Trypsin